MRVVVFCDHSRCLFFFSVSAFWVLAVAIGGWGGDRRKARYVQGLWAEQEIDGRVALVDFAPKRVFLLVAGGR